MRYRQLSALFAFFIFCLAVWAVWEAGAWDIQARLAPWIIGIPTLVLSGAVVIMELTAVGRRSQDDRGRKVAEMVIEEAMHRVSEAGLDPKEERQRTTRMIAWILGFASAIWFLGFHFGIPLATLLYLRMTGRERWWITLTMTAAVWLSVAIFFDCTMHIFFTEGQLFVWLGVKSAELNASACQALAHILPG